MEIIIKGALVNSNLTNKRFLNILNQDVKEGVEYYCLQPTEGRISFASLDWIIIINKIETLFKVIGSIRKLFNKYLKSSKEKDSNSDIYIVIQGSNNQIKIGDINSNIELEQQINNSLKQLDLADKKENANEIRNSSSWKQIK